MKKKTTLVIFLLILSIYTLNINVQSAVEKNNYRPTSLELTPHDPIEITSDSDFAIFNGSGTAEDPYLIEGYNITTTDDKSIYISLTTKYFIVRNCYVDATYDGIYIDDVAEGTATVINNTCNNNNGIGIFIVSSGSSIVANNTCINNNDYGILIHSSGRSIVANNTCNNNDIGIVLFSSDFCVVTYNLLQENRYCGVDIFHYSNNALIHHNTFVDNDLGGTSQANDDSTNNTWYDTVTQEGNYWSDLGDKCKYEIQGSAHSKDLYPLNRAQSCPNPITMKILSIVLPLLVSVAILAFVVPKYVIPYFRKRKA